MQHILSVEPLTPTNTYINHNSSINSEVIETQILLHPNSVLKESLFEFLGMYVFITLSLGNVATYSLYPEANLNWTGLAFSWGLNLMFGIYLSSFYSPSHLNPAVSLCIYLFKKSISLTELVYFTISQFLASFLAAATIYGIYYNKLGDADSYGNVFTTSPNSEITQCAAWFTEFLGTALLAGGIFMLSDHDSTKHNLPVYVGLWLTSLVFAFGFPTAFAWNPARDLGPRVFASCVGYSTFSYADYYFWIPLTADYIGAIIGVAIYQYLINP